MSLQSLWLTATYQPLAEIKRRPSVTSRRTGNLLTHPPDTTVNDSVSHTWSNLTDSTLIDCFWPSTCFDFGYGSSRSTVSYNVNVLGVGIADNTTVQKTADEPFVRGISWKQQPARCDSAGDSGRDEHRRSCHRMT